MQVHARLLTACIGVALLLSGCGGAEFGGEVRVPIEHQHVLGAQTVPAAAPLSLPVDQPFAIHIKRSSQAPSATGEARGESDATGDGNAVAAATASKGGSASAEFNLGHRIVNRSDAAQIVSIELESAMKQDITTSAVPVAQTMASASLVFIVLDSRQHALATIRVLQADADTSPGQATAQNRHQLSVRFEPGETYDAMFFGKVDVATSPNQDAAARLELKGLRMKLTFSPATTQAAR